MFLVIFHPLFLLFGLWNRNIFAESAVNGSTDGAVLPIKKLENE